MPCAGCRPKIGHGKGLQVADAIADAHCLIANPFEIGIDLDHRENKAQIDRHGLFHGQQIEGHLVDLALKAVDRYLTAIHQIADREITDAISLHRTLDRLLGHARHDKQPLLQIVELSMEPDSRHPNLPVM